MDGCLVGGDHTKRRHTREGGKPVWCRPTHARDSRLRGNGKVMKCRSSPIGRFPIFVIQDLIGDYPRDIRRPPSSLRGAVRRSNRQPSTMQRSEEHTSELQSLMRISYAVFCLKKKNTTKNTNTHNNSDISNP